MFFISKDIKPDFRFFHMEEKTPLQKLPSDDSKQPSLSDIRNQMLKELATLKQEIVEEKDFIPVSVEKDKSLPSDSGSLRGLILKELNRLQEELLVNSDYAPGSAGEYDEDVEAKQESIQLYNLMQLRNQFVEDLAKMKQMKGTLVEMQSPKESKESVPVKDNVLSKLFSGLKRAFKK